MKINDKNLSAFASSTTQIDREGYLMKKGDSAGGGGGGGSKPFSKRWFVLKGNLLFYFDKKTDKEPLGVIILEGSTVELAESEFEQHFCFKVTFPSKSYILSAESQGSMELWMKSLACASYDYVKLMADELQRQLDELCKNDAVDAAAAATGGGNNNYSPVPTPPPRVKLGKQQGGGCGRGGSTRKTFSTLHQEFGVKILKDSKSRWDNKRNSNHTSQQQPPLLSSLVQNDLMNF